MLDSAKSLLSRTEHSARTASPTGSAAEWVLQRVPTDRPCDRRELFWRSHRDPARGAPQAELIEDGAIAFGADTNLSFDTYFGSFFETPWRMHTELADLSLRVRIEGRAALRIARRVPGNYALLHDAEISGEVVVNIPAPLLNFRQHGVVGFHLRAVGGPAVFRDACWVTTSTPVRAVNLAAVICTFNREHDLAAVLATLAGDPLSLSRLARIIVVNQGRPDLTRRPPVALVAAALGDRLQVIEQDNFGGAGGFSRGLLAAIDDPTLDHVVFLDDDIAIEPDSLARMASFMALARGEIPVGGHMLDSVQPMRLYEAGAVIGERHWTFHPEHHNVNLADAQCLDHLIDPRPVHYNGWWCFGFPLSMVARMGMPLPCFIRGDDTEFGLRLYQAGIHTVPLPGVAVWHAPFYLKFGGWHLYYETRNTLVAMARHGDTDARRVTRRMARQILVHILTYRYYSTALVLRGIQDYLRGPEIMHGPPAALHAGLDALRVQFGPSTISRATIMGGVPIPRLPRSRLGYLAALLRCGWRNWSAPTVPGAPPQRIGADVFSWLSVEHANHVALETWWDQQMPSLQRSREHFRLLLPQIARALFALYRHGPAAAAQWRHAAEGLTSVPFWRRYLNLPAAKS